MNTKSPTMSNNLRRPPMIVAGNKPDPDTLLITIDHTADQSYSRAVDPRAMRAAREHILGGERWALVDADYGQPTTVTDGRADHFGGWSRSVYRFERQAA